MIYKYIQLSERLLLLQMAAAGESASEWWEARGAVPFACTECGKCCQVRGDVWASPEDSSRLASHLHIDVKTLAEQYGRMEVEGWIQMKDKPEGGCIFLAEDGKACGVYEGRPVQVSPSLLCVSCWLPNMVAE